jgi:hypothetical protein
MEKLFIIMSICSFIANLFWLVADITGTKSVFLILLVKTIALFGVLTPILYWLKLLNIIN